MNGKYRARNKNGEYVYGNLVNGPGFAFIVTFKEYIANNERKFKNINQDIDIFTLGEKTGFKDTNGKEIYSGKKTVSVEIIDLSKEDFDIIKKDDLFYLSHPSQSEYELGEALKNNNLLILSKD